MLTRLDLRASAPARSAVGCRAPNVAAGPVAAVREILAEVRGGDEALLALTERFDGVRPAGARRAPADWDAALDRIGPALRAALEAAAAPIRAFQEAERSPDVTHDAGGITTCTLRPVDRAGCYVPGGRAVYPSTVLMTVIPAGRRRAVGRSVRAAGPGRPVPDVVLAAAAIAGADAVHPVGGAQAIAALAYGTESIPAVDVIVGPGNVYVAVAKREVAGEGSSACPRPSRGRPRSSWWPTSTVPADLAAVDVLVQAEHGPDGLAWLVGWDEAVVDAVWTRWPGSSHVAPPRHHLEATLAVGLRRADRRSPSRRWRWPTRSPPSTSSCWSTTPRRSCRRCATPEPCSAGPWHRRRSATTWPGPTTSCPPSGRHASPAPCRLDDFSKHIHVVVVPPEGLTQAAPRRGPGRGRGPTGPRGVGPPSPTRPGQPA